LDLAKRAAEVTAKDRLKVVFVSDPLLLPCVWYDVGSTVEAEMAVTCSDGAFD